MENKVFLEEVMSALFQILKCIGEVDKKYKFNLHFYA
jgi:hypothetical protein